MRGNPPQKSMSDTPNKLSRSAEDYLETIGHLCHKNGCAQVSDIAEMMGVKKPSVTAAMRRLAGLGMIEYRQYSPIQLTEKGARYAEGVISAHRVLYRFMSEVAGLQPERAGEAACMLEHVLTKEEIDGIANRMGASLSES